MSLENGEGNMSDSNEANTYTINGITLSIPDFIMSPKLHDDLASGTYESREIFPIRANIRPHDVVLELGAAIGFISTVVAKLFDNVHVVSYEANPEMLPIARNNHKINGVDVELREGLVTGMAVPDEVEFWVDKTFFWDSGIVPRAHNNGSIREKVFIKSIPFHKIISEIRPTVLIIDIEGSEVGLFDSVVNLDCVRNIFFELHAFIGPYEIYKLIKRLDELGFCYDRTYSIEYIVTFKRRDQSGDSPAVMHLGAQKSKPWTRFLKAIWKRSTESLCC